MKLSGGGIGQYLISTSSWLVLYYILAEFGSAVIAGFTISIRLVIFFLLPAWGLSSAASTLVGQNLGANNPGRAENSVWIISIFTTGYMLIVMLLFLFIPDGLIQIFTDEEAIQLIGKTGMMIISAGLIFYGFEMIISQAFNGAGDTYTPTILNFVGFWIIQIPLAWYLAEKAAWNENGVFWAIVISESILGVLGLIIFKQGKWKLNKV